MQFANQSFCVGPIAIPPTWYDVNQQTTVAGPPHLEDNVQDDTV